eukprot:scaffold262_cov230-Pinguiococcus_pyrenoidosus.AAC.4
MSVSTRECAPSTSCAVANTSMVPEGSPRTSMVVSSWKSPASRARTTPFWFTSKAKEYRMGKSCSGSDQRLVVHVKMVDSGPPVVGVETTCPPMGAWFTVRAMEADAWSITVSPSAGRAVNVKEYVTPGAKAEEPRFTDSVSALGLRKAASDRAMELPSDPSIVQTGSSKASGLCGGGVIVPSIAAKPWRLENRSPSAKGNGPSTETVTSGSVWFRICRDVTSVAVRFDAGSKMVTKTCASLTLSTRRQNLSVGASLACPREVVELWQEALFVFVLRVAGAQEHRGGIANNAISVLDDGDQLAPSNCNFDLLGRGSAERGGGGRAGDVEYVNRRRGERERRNQKLPHREAAIKALDLRIHAGELEGERGCAQIFHGLASTVQRG